MIAVCDYCRRSQRFESHNGQCESCGAPLPKPAPRLVSRTFDVTREMIDVTSMNDQFRTFIPGRLSVLLKETTKE